MVNVYNGLLTCKLFSQVFEEDALQWEEKLNRIHDVFDVWIDVQRRWVYLDGIFSGSADIKALLPVETQRFQRWVKVCALRATPDLLQISDSLFNILFFTLSVSAQNFSL